MLHTDTIAAVSTPLGIGGVALIRVTGADAIPCAARVFFPASGISLENAVHSQAYYGRIKRGENVVDDGMATVFRAPRSFTGEDTVEITCHGGVLVTYEVLSAVLSSGARQAEAGEFTRRAFVNGKLTLSQAEATGELLHAKTRAQLELSSFGAKSVLSAETESLRRALTELLARIAVRIDYPEEDLSDIDETELLSECTALLSRIDKLTSTYRTGRAVSVGVDTVICGRPNAGKSTLYNLFTGDEAAIVTDIPGTTRDTLTAEVSAGRVLLKLSDTAGIRDAADKVEAIGISRARSRMSVAELLLTVHDAAEPPAEEDGEILSADAPVKLAVINKTDLKTAFYADDYKALAVSHGAVPVICALTEKRGFDELVRLINEAFTDGTLKLGTDAILSNARQYSEALAAREALASAVKALRDGLPIDIAEAELEAALSAISRLDGREVADEVISEIFSKFCVGK